MRKSRSTMRRETERKKIERKRRTQRGWDREATEEELDSGQRSFCIAILNG